MEDAAVRRSHQAGAELRLVLAESRGALQRAENVVLGDPERHVDEPGRPRQQAGEAPRQGRAGRSLVPPQQHPTDDRVDGGQQQRQLRIGLVDHRAEGESPRRIRSPCVADHDRNSSQPACRLLSRWEGVVLREVGPRTRR
jgi:hypothetical protein